MKPVKVNFLYVAASIITTIIAGAASMVHVSISYGLTRDQAVTDARMVNCIT